MKGYNLPDNVSPSDPEAPWNEEEDQKPKTFIFTRTARIFYRVVGAETPDEAGEILCNAMYKAKGYEDHTEVSDPDFIYYGEVE